MAPGCRCCGGICWLQGNGFLNGSSLSLREKCLELSGVRALGHSPVTLTLCDGDAAQDSWPLCLLLLLHISWSRVCFQRCSFTLQEKILFEHSFCSVQKVSQCSLGSCSRAALQTSETCSGWCLQTTGAQGSEHKWLAGKPGSFGACFDFSLSFQSNTLSTHQGAGQGDALFSHLVKSISCIIWNTGSRNVIKCREGTHQALYCGCGRGEPGLSLLDLSFPNCLLSLFCISCLSL